MGSGLTIERGGEIVAEMAGRGAPAADARTPAGRAVDRPLPASTSATCASVGSSEKTPNVAVIVRSVDQIVPADGAGFEHGSITSMLRAWSCDSPFVDLPFTSLLIADNLNDVEPLIASTAQTVRTRVPLPDAAALEQALDILRKQSPQRVRGGCQPAADRRHAHGRHGLEPRKPHAHSPPREQAAGRRRSRQAQERAGGARLGRPRGIHRRQTHAQRLPRAGSAQDLAAPGHRVVARRRPQGPAHGLSTLRPGGHGQDLPGRVPGRRSRRAGGQAQEFPRSLGGILRRQPREDIPAHPRARPLHGVHRRGRPDAGQTGLGRERLGPLRPHLLDDRAGDVGQRQSRPRVVVVSLLAARISSRWT